MLASAEIYSLSKILKREASKCWTNNSKGKTSKQKSVC